MKLYETGIIYDPTLEDSQFDKQIEQVETIIKSNGGKIVDVSRWGMRRLAYEIRKKQQGFYVFFQYESDGTVPGKLEKSFLINESIMRFMTVVPDWIQTETGEEKAAVRPSTESY